MDELLKITALLLANYMLACLYAVIMADRLIFPCPPSSYTDDDVGLRVPADDGSEIPAIWLPAEKPKATLLYCHGNAEDLGDIRPVLELYPPRGYNVLAVDYPGYGMAEGKATEEGCVLAVDAGYDYLCESLGIDPSTILAYGRSLGGGPATDLASRRPLGGLIHEATFTSTFRVQTHFKLLPWDIFDNLALMPEVRCPLLSLHGSRDRTVNWKHAHKLYALADPKRRMRFWPLDVGHNDLISRTGETYWRTLDSFVAMTLRDRLPSLEAPSNPQAASA